MDLTHYRTLGRSGLLVSPLALGTMTFGAQRWGTDAAASRAVFDAYVDAGGNVVDTADLYSDGRSEAMLGDFIADAGARERLVVATKSGFPRMQGNAHGGGNCAKNIRAALDGSLARLRTDYIDLYWMHVWDRLTPPEEVLQTMTDAVRAGRILHYGFSNTPAWYVARVATLAQAHGLPMPIGLQYQYSLLDRGVELDIVPAGNALGLGLMPWSPLGGGLLTGKYGRDKLAEASRTARLPGDASGDETARSDDDGRLDGDNPFGGMLFTEQLRHRRRGARGRRRAGAFDGRGGAGVDGGTARCGLGAGGRQPCRPTAAEHHRARHHTERRPAAAPRRGEPPACAQPVLHLPAAGADAFRCGACGGVVAAAVTARVRRCGGDRPECARTWPASGLVGVVARLGRPH